MKQPGNGAGRQGARVQRSVLLAMFALIGVILLGAEDVAAQDVYTEETLEISRKLECPVCAGQTVADSTSKLAGQMRAIIDEKVRAGESEDEIIDYFVARYGESVVTEPPKSGFSLTLWWMPVMVVVLGATVVWLFVRERTLSTPRRPAVADGHDTDEELESIAREVLGQPSGERMPGA